MLIRRNVCGKSSTHLRRQNVRFGKLAEAITSERRRNCRWGENHNFLHQSGEVSKCKEIKIIIKLPLNIINKIESFRVGLCCLGLCFYYFKLKSVLWCLFSWFFVSFRLFSLVIEVSIPTYPFHYLLILSSLFLSSFFFESVASDRDVNNLCSQNSRPGGGDIGL